jgi:hypothetical protein
MFMTLMERFKKCLLEEDEEPCGSMVRVDKLGNRVVIPYGGTLQSGKNGRGVAIPKGFTAKEDHVGQMHAIPPGKVLKIGTNGSGVVVCPRESTSEKRGQIVVNRRNPKNESRKPSCLDLLEWSRMDGKS